MPKILISVLIAISLFSYKAKSQQTASNAVDSVKVIYKQFLKAGEEVNAELLMSFFKRSPNFRFVTQDGFIIRDYDSFHDILRNAYSGLVGQVAKMEEPFIHFPSPDCAVAIVSGEFTATQKDNRTYGGPVAWTLVFTRDSGQWKIINFHQSFKLR